MIKGADSPLPVKECNKTRTTVQKRGGHMP